MSGIAYVDGRISAIEEAAISVEDRGLQFGDSVYEVVRFEHGRYFRLGPHLDRLRQSLQAIALPPPLPPDEMAREVGRLREASGLAAGILYIQITRGTAPRYHAFPPESRPTLIMTIRPLPPVAEVVQTQGIRLVTHPDLRWGRCDIKSTALLANVLAREHAARGGGHEALLYEADGTITECSAANFFAVIDGVVWTHPADARILHGVTRGIVVDLCGAAGVACRQVSVHRDDLPRAAEAFITGTGIEILPVGEIDDDWRRPPGPVTRGLQQAFRRLVERETRGSQD